MAVFVKNLANRVIAQQPAVEKSTKCTFYGQDNFRVEAASRYLTLFETITGESIQPRLTTAQEIATVLNA